MKINVSSILRSIDSNKEVNGQLEIPLIKYNGDDIPVNTPIQVNAVITNSGDNLTIVGKLEANLTLKCSRCLENYDVDIESEFEEQFSNREEDEEAIYFEGDIIDLTETIINNIILALPMKFVCSKDCMGLCSHCGSNKNFVKCQCADDSVDPRLAVLKELLKED